MLISQAAVSVWEDLLLLRKGPPPPSTQVAELISGDAR